MLLLSCASEIKFYNCDRYNEVQKYKPADNSSLQRSLSWCKDGSLISLVTNKGNAEIIGTKDDVKLLQSINGSGQTSAITFQKTTKKNVALGTIAGAVHVYDIKSRSIKKIFTKSGNTVSMLEWNCKDSHLAVLTKCGELSLYNNITNVKSCNIEMKESKTISTFRFHQTYKSLLSCASDEGGVSVWDCHTSKNKFFVRSHTAPVTDLVFSPQNNTLLASTSLDSLFHCYDSKQQQIAITVESYQPLSAIDMAPNGRTVAVGSIRGVILIYDLRKYTTPVSTIQAHENEIKRILFQPQDTHFTEVFDISEEAAMPVAPKNTSIDSFACIINNVNEFSPKIELEQKTRRTESLSDSFLGALSPAIRRNDNYSIEKLKDMSNLGITEGVKKWIDSKINLDSSNPPCGGLPEIQEMIIGKSQTSSTPILGSKHMPINEDIQDSPIISSSNVNNIEEICKVIKETVKGSVKETVNDTVKGIIQETVNDVCDQKMREIMDAVHKYYLNLHITFCRQFVFQESSLKKLLSAQPKDSQMELLKEENEFLKRKLNEFMEKNK